MRSGVGCKGSDAGTEKASRWSTRRTLFLLPEDTTAAPAKPSISKLPFNLAHFSYQQPVSLDGVHRKKSLELSLLIAR